MSLLDRCPARCGSTVGCVACRPLFPAGSVAPPKLPPVFKRQYPGRLRLEERDIDQMGEAELRILVKRLLAELDAVR